jgi:hypothetical protein
LALSTRPRKSANRTAIKITIAPVAKTSRSARKRRIGSLLDKAVAFGMALRHQHAHLAKGFSIASIITPGTWTTVELSRSFSASGSSRKNAYRGVEQLEPHARTRSP